MKKRGFAKDTAQKIKKEYREIAGRAKDIGPSRLLNAYIMGIYFIALNRSTGKTAEENFLIFKEALCASHLFRKVMGNADSYLDEKKNAGTSAVVSGQP